MLRISSSNVLVVPPFECAWLAGPQFQLVEACGCLSFDVKGENDVTVIFKSTPGAKRWQPLQLQASTAGQETMAVEQNYTVILGSHRNSRLKFEKNGTTHKLVENVPGAKLDSKDFHRYWINYQDGVISVGSGNPGENIAYQWTDPDQTIKHIRHVGLSCWDKHVSYRNIHLHPTVSFAAVGVAGPMAPAVPTLFQLAGEAAETCLTPQCACVTAAVAEYLLPTTAALYKHALQYIAQHFVEVVEADGEGVLILTAQVVADVLGHPSLACGEKVLFDVVVHWAQGGASGAQGGRCRSRGELEAVLPLIRFPHMTEAELQAVASHPFTLSQPLVQELLAEALHVHADANAAITAEQGSLFLVESRRLVAFRGAGVCGSAVRLQRRLPGSYTELMYVFDGDGNGVIRHIGTNYGTEGWVNPVLSKRLVVKASSPPSRFTDPKALVSGQFVRTSFAGPRYEGLRPVAWWMVDLGAANRLVCNYYSVRQDDSQEFMRSWKLQARHTLAHQTHAHMHTLHPLTH